MKNSVFKAILVIGLINACVGFIVSCNVAVGVGGWGPTRYVVATVNKTYVEHSGDSSHYMVGTDHGVFEVDNGLLLGTYHADVIFSDLREGHTYMMKVKGKERVNIFMQYYPYITSASETAKKLE